jgi:ubiquinone/menaquinone biosynthesis C-methylase UbiE
VKVEGRPQRLLDVGGGHGLYSVAFCRRYAGLRAEVLDLPEAAEVGQRLVTEAGMSERVSYRPGDMRQVEWGEGYDCVLLFNVLHNATEVEAKEAVGRALRALRPGGTLAIMDAEYRGATGDLDATSGFGELFFYVVSGARTWPEATMRGWMEEAGFERSGTARLWIAPAVLLTGRRPK